MHPKTLTARPGGPISAVVSFQPAERRTLRRRRCRAQARDGTELPARIRRLKAEIAAGTYETETKLDLAIDRLIQEFEREAEE